MVDQRGIGMDRIVRREVAAEQRRHHPERDHAVGRSPPASGNSKPSSASRSLGAMSDSRRPLASGPSGVWKDGSMAAAS